MKHTKHVHISGIVLAWLTLFALVSCTTTPVPVTPETALQSYLHNDDQSYAWELSESMDLGGPTAHTLLLTSQEWRGHTWRHTLTVIVPEEVNYDGALLFITGGKNEEGMPVKRGRDDDFVKSLAGVAVKNSAVVAIVWQIPNQPLYDGKNEDELISFTLHNYQNDGDFTWPLLFPMVKSAVKAMDALQEFSEAKLQHDMNRFVLSGASKRGWTTWLTGANDPRVEAIAPMVIDVLNMPVNLDYQIKVWNEYSIQIQDYVKLGIPQQVHDEQGKEIVAMVDPYSYRDSLDMPKMIFIGTNDEYWPVDAVKNYIDDIPGENYIHYVPNAGHNLGGGEQALKALSAFFGNTMRHDPYPVCHYKLTEDGSRIMLSVEASPDKLLAARLWSTGSGDRDFRDESWNSQEIETPDQKLIEAEVETPGSGYTAFYVDLEYADPMGGSYTESTRMFVTDSTGVLKD